MNSINPSLASATQSLQSYSQVNRNAEVMQQSAPASNSTSSATTVTLSSGQPQAMVDYSGLNNQQTVRNTTQVQQPDTNANQTSSGMTYATSLQNQSSYYLTQSANNTNTSGNPTESTANQNANMASE